MSTRTTRRQPRGAQEVRMPDTTASVRFLGDWRQVQQGAIERGGRIRIEYETQRLRSCFMPWRGAEFGDITAQIRFYPRGSRLSCRATPRKPRSGSTTSRKPPVAVMRGTADLETTTGLTSVALPH